MDRDLLLSSIVGRMDLNEYSATRSKANSDSTLALFEWPNLPDLLLGVDEDNNFRHRFAVSINVTVFSSNNMVSDGPNENDSDATTSIIEGT
jgi:hypothetical protein